MEVILIALILGMYIVDRQLNLELKENYDLIFLILFFSYLRYVMTFDKKEEEEENIRKYDDEFLLLY